MLVVKHKSSHMLGMNKLPTHKRVQILSMLVEGSSMWSISRVVDVSINTVQSRYRYGLDKLRALMNSELEP